MKEWDPVVFPQKAVVVVPRDRAHRKDGKNAPCFGPEKRILLLCGPPGCGKTTLAHVVARHAGYAPLEINASDVRNGDQIRSKVLGATQMRSVFGDQRPHCLIIDEIDGSFNGNSQDQGLVQLLLKLIREPTKQAKKTSADDADEADEAGSDVESEPVKERAGYARGSKAGRSVSTGTLSRPIICICNNLYAPVLRPLRAAALVFTVTKVSTVTLSSRLAHVARKERLAVDMRTLVALCEMTDCDIRACLHTMQFLGGSAQGSSTRTKSSRQLTLDLLAKSHVGVKDMGRSLFSVWEDIFQLRKPKRGAKTLAFKAQLLDSSSERFVAELKQAIHANGDEEKLAQGCFENYLRMPIKDSCLTRLNRCGPWLDFYDRLQDRLHARQQFEFSDYLAYALISFHPHCATSQRPQLAFPRDFELQQLQRQNEQVLESVRSALPPQITSGYPPSRLALELVSPVLRIISPRLRVVRSHLA